ncbi:MAG: rhomboid family intramembrane serine protease [Actinomycetota bacterium]
MFPLKDRNPTHHVAFITIALIVVNVLVFVAIQDRGASITGVTLPSGEEVGIQSGDKFSLQYAAIPCELTERGPLDVDDVRNLLRGDTDACDDADGDPLFADKSVWLAVITSMFLHADWFHLLFNMWFLWIFGNNIEDHVGPVKYIGFYLAAGIAATVAHVALQPDSSIPVIGASGAIAGVMGAYLIWFPRAPIATILAIFIFDIRALWLLLGWFVLQFFTGADSQVAWAAHVGGFVFGAVAGALVRQIRPLCRWVWREPWRSQAYYRWDLTGGSADSYRTHERGRPRFGGRSW